jgi:hypothetical protein
MADDSIFGHSLKMTDGDLVIQGDQLVEISGRDNLVQALTLRILTPFGSDVFNTGYGLDITSAFTQPNTARIVKEIIKLNLVRTLATDARVSDVREVVFEDDPEYRLRHPEVADARIALDHLRRLWLVDVVLETSDGATQVLPASVGV